MPTHLLVSHRDAIRPLPRPAPLLSGGAPPLIVARRQVTGRRGYNKCSREALSRIITRDTAFLRGRGLFDYSLLVGVHRREGDSRSERAPGLVVLESSEELQYICIIDALSQYALLNRLQTFFLSTLRCGADISCQPPDRYARRFEDFVGDTMA